MPNVCGGAVDNDDVGIGGGVERAEQRLPGMTAPRSLAEIRRTAAAETVQD
jgi:hypothetical protein